jgi:transcriptional regulator with XRE-family HTH domain
MRKNASIILYTEQKKINRENISKVRSSVGLWIKEQREEMKLSKIEFAEILGIKMDIIDQIELGKWMSFEVLIKISIILEDSAFNKNITSRIVKDGELFIPDKKKISYYPILVKTIDKITKTK